MVIIRSKLIKYNLYYSVSSIYWFFSIIYD